MEAPSCKGVFPDDDVSFSRREPVEPLVRNTSPEANLPSSVRKELDWEDRYSGFGGKDEISVLVERR